MAEQLPPPKWDVPFPYAHAAAIEQMGSIAAPLFAGFAVTISFQVLGREESFRWPNLATGLLLGAAFFLGASVQLSFRARQYAVTPPDIEVWFPDPDAELELMMRREQRLHRNEYRRWSGHARMAYSIGLLAFLLGLVVTLVPPGSPGDGRTAVLILAAVAFAAELTWFLQSTFDPFNRRRKFQLPEADPPPIASTVESGTP